MIACTPPPPPLAAIVRQATTLVAQRVAPVGMPTICMDASVPAGSGMSMPGAVWVASADATIYSTPPSTWPADRHVMILHEVLHQIAMAQELEAGPQLDQEEGITEAVTHDLRPQWLRMVRGRDAVVPVAYRQRVAAVRIASARATGARWTSPAARAWRYATIAAPPASRPVIPGI